MDCISYVAKIKALISCAVTAPLFSHMQKAGFLQTRLTLIALMNLPTHILYFNKDQLPHFL